MPHYIHFPSLKKLNAETLKKLCVSLFVLLEGETWHENKVNTL